jgi:predicted RNA-binding Zn-ribbon protein involved in translation (DUF1610 family)
MAETEVTVALEPNDDLKKSLNEIKEAADAIMQTSHGLRPECDMTVTNSEPFTLNGCYEYECSECGEYMVLQFEPGEKVEKPRFCQNCGRQVRGR